MDATDAMAHCPKLPDADAVLAAFRRVGDLHQKVEARTPRPKTFRVFDIAEAKAIAVWRSLVGMRG